MLKALLLAILLLHQLPVRGQPLEILTEEDPPYSFIGQDGTITGAGVAIVREIQRRIDNRDPIKMVPWARAYFNTQKHPNVVVFTMSRTRAREPLFQWIGPIIENNWVIIAKKTSDLQLKTLDEAMTLKSIGVVRGYAWTDYLEQKKFKNLKLAVSHRSNAKMLHSGRVQTLISTDLTYKAIFSAVNLNPDDYEIIFTVKNVQMYVAHSQKTPQTIVQKWQVAFQSMKVDGTLLKILQTWLPGSHVPEYIEPTE